VGTATSTRLARGLPTTPPRPAHTPLLRCGVSCSRAAAQERSRGATTGRRAAAAADYQWRMEVEEDSSLQNVGKKCWSTKCCNNLKKMLIKKYLTKPTFLKNDLTFLKNIGTQKSCPTF
jgi:hypothetical protein